MKFKEKKGITLIALVITIVVLLILTAIALNLTLGENGIVSRAKSAKIHTRKAQAEEQLNIDITRIRVEKENNISLSDLLDDFKKNDNTNIIVTEILYSEVGYLGDSVTEIPTEKPISITVAVKGFEEFEFTIGQNCAITKVCGVNYNEWAG